MFWTLPVLAVKKLVESVLVIGVASHVRAVHVDDAQIEESALDSQPAHSVVDWPPTNHALRHFAQHYKSCPQLVCIAAAPIHSVVTVLPVVLPRPAHLLQRHDFETADPQFVGKNAVAPIEVERPAVPRPEFPIPGSPKIGSAIGSARIWSSLHLVFTAGACSHHQPPVSPEDRRTRTV